MPKPSPIVRDLFERLRISPAVSAQVDWVSGTLRVNRGAREWQAFFKNPTGDLSLLTTLEHEAHHILQISTLTYLYHFAILLHAIIAGLLDEHYGDLATLPDTLGENEETARNLLWDLVWRDEDELAPKDMVESVTYFALAHGNARRSVQDYVEYLESTRPADTYRRGFDVFSRHVGARPNAVVFYPLLTHLALCCWDPRKAFKTLLGALASGRVDEQTSLDEYLALAKEIEPGFRGFAWEYAKRLPGMPFRFTFSDVQARLTQDQKSLQGFLPYLFDPGKHIESLFLQAIGNTPAILNPVADAENEGFSVWPVDMRGIRDFGRFRLEDRRYWLQYLAAVSRKYIEGIGTPPPGVTRTPK